MNATRTDAAEIHQALEHLGALMLARDPAIVARFMPDAVLVGSEPGEIARGSAELDKFFAAIFQLPLRITWSWTTVDSGSAGDAGWLFAEGEAVIRDENGERRRPYRLSGVLARSDGAWKWRLFHGSEPAAQP